MSVPVPIPKLGMTMAEATLVEWVSPDGASVAEGDVLCVIETDKVESEVLAPSPGVVRHRAAEGETYNVGYVLAEVE